MGTLRELGGAERVFELGWYTSIGRDPSSTIQVHSRAASRKHVVILKIEDGRFQLLDLSSHAGTYVGGERAFHHDLEDGDEIVVGDVPFRFENASEFRTQPSQVHILSDPDDSTVGEWMPVRRDLHFDSQADIVDEGSLRRQYEQLRAAYALSRVTGGERDLRRLAELTVDTALELLSADRGAIVLVAPESDKPTLRVSRSRGEHTSPVHLSASIIREVIANRAGVITGDEAAPTKFLLGVPSAMCVPVLYGGEIMGVMQVDSCSPQHLFDRRDLELFSSIASQAAMAIKNMLLHRQLSRVVSDERERLGLLFQDLPFGIVALDDRHRVVLANAWGEALLPGLTETRRGEELLELAGRRLDDLLGEVDTDGVVDLQLRGSRPRTVSLSCVRTGGIGPAENIVLMLKDVTHERDRDRQAEQQQRLALMGQLSGAVAHDLNNLLSVILSCSEMLQEDAALGKEAREDVDSIRRAALAAAQLSKGLRAFSSREFVRSEIVDLNHSVSTLEKLLRRTFKPPLQLRSDLDPDLACIKASPSSIEQVLMNLAINARDAMPEGGLLTITTRNLSVRNESTSLIGPFLPGDYVQVDVTDTGCGISEGDLVRLFEPFFTTKAEGTGLGLATVYGIVKQAGGHIQVESARHVGTRFRLLFPAVDEGAWEASGVGERAIHGASCLVLVVDDQEPVRRSIQRMLEGAGYRVSSSSNPVAVMKMSEDDFEAVDLLLTDLVMPGMSGKDLAAALRRRRPNLPVLYMSGHLGDAVRPNSEDLASGFLPKPFTAKELLRKLDELLQAG